MSILYVNSSASYIIQQILMFSITDNTSFETLWTSDGRQNNVMCLLVYGPVIKYKAFSKYFFIAIVNYHLAIFQLKISKD